MEGALFTPHVRGLNRNHVRDVRFGMGFLEPARDNCYEECDRKDAGSVIGFVFQECEPERCTAVIYQFFEYDMKQSGRYLDGFTGEIVRVASTQTILNSS